MPETRLLINEHMVGENFMQNYFSLHEWRGGLLKVKFGARAAAGALSFVTAAGVI